MFKLIKTKGRNSFLLQRKEEIVQEVGFSSFRERERESYFSLDFPSFGSSVRFGPRSKVVLRGKGYAWAPILWTFDNSKR